MNIEAWVPAIITVISVIFSGGMLVGRIKDQEITLERHDTSINKLANRTTRLEAWKDGYNAAMQIQHKEQEQ